MRAAHICASQIPAHSVPNGAPLLASRNLHGFFTVGRREFTRIARLETIVRWYKLAMKVEGKMGNLDKYLLGVAVGIMAFGLALVAAKAAPKMKARMAGH